MGLSESQFYRKLKLGEILTQRDLMRLVVNEVQGCLAFADYAVLLPEAAEVQ